jgi:tRNA nucleotidyltransferase (CCA-adding enzyme)
MTGAPLLAPPAVNWIARTLEDAGFETWTVGGAVRDALRGQPSGDWDLTTLARPDDMRRLFKRTVPIGVEHGTVGILARDGTMYEVTTFRKDVETDGRHAVIAFADRVDDDLARRDFTMNAIAWHPLRDELLDPFGGVADIRDGVLRTVGVAGDRFAEDHLRVLRALRFAGRFGFGIAEPTWSALCSVTGYLQELSPERIREELIKILDTDPAPSASLDLYRSSGVLEALYPELAAVESEVWSATLAALDELPVGHPMLRLAALLWPVADAAHVAAVLFRLRLSNAQVDETALRVGAPSLPKPDADDTAFRVWLSTVGPERASALSRLELARAVTSGGDAAAVVASWRAARRVRRARPPLTVADLALDGSVLIRLGLKPGPRFGEILDELLAWVLDDPSRNRTDLLESEVGRIVAATEEEQGD